MSIQRALLLTVSAVTALLASSGAMATTESLFLVSDVHSDSGIPTALTTRYNNCVNNTGQLCEVLCVVGDLVDTNSYTQAAHTSLNAVTPNHLFAQGNHDSATYADGTGAGLSGDNYVTYVIDWNDFDGYSSTDTSLATNLETWLSASLASGKVAIVLSHAPLHSTRSGIDQGAANAIFDLLQAYGEVMDIVFAWGHNHSKTDYDVNVDRIAVPGETIAWVDTANTSLNANAFETLNFACLNAGYWKAASSTSIIKLTDTQVYLYRNVASNTTGFTYSRL